MKEKFVVTADEPKGRGMSDDRGKRSNWCTREAMDFDPKSTPLYSPRDVFKYLAKNDIQVPPKIMVKWCHLKTDVTVAPLHGSVFIHL